MTLYHRENGCRLESHRHEWVSNNYIFKTGVKWITSYKNYTFVLVFFIIESSANKCWQIIYIHTAHKKFMNTSTSAEFVASFILDGRYLETQTSLDVEILKYFISNGPLTDWHIVQNKTSKLPLNHYIIPRHNFVPVSMEVNFKGSC